jgi:putative tryptophan/tyrosine transport system substrate-binding protein
MNKILTALIASFFLFGLVITGSAEKKASQGTKEEAQAMVEKAAEWFKKYGREKTLAEITRSASIKKGDFKDRDLYIFAYDFNGVCLAHGDNPKLIGKNLYDWQDADGRYNIRAHIDVALKKGSGWSPVYKWINPVTKKIELKLTYVKKIDDTLWIGCGVYGKEAQPWVEKKIGILVASEQTRYDVDLRGVMDQLAQDGYRKPAVTFIIENAQGSHVKAAELMSKFAATKLDMIITIGTIATKAAIKKIKDVPIVFSHVYNPVAAGIAVSWKSSGNNSTGVSPRISMFIPMQKLQEFKRVKSLAVLFTPGQINSELELKELQEIQVSFGIQVIGVPVTNKEEVSQILLEVVHTMDAIYLTGSTIVGETVELITDMANKEKMVTITHNDDMVRKGALLGVCPNSYDLGRMAGKKAVKILNGAKPSSITIDVPKKIDILLNMKSVIAGQFQIPAGFMKNVTKTIE